jgi:hypothetical protein
MKSNVAFPVQASMPSGLHFPLRGFSASCMLTSTASAYAAPSVLCFARPAADAVQTFMVFSHDMFCPAGGGCPPQYIDGVFT